MNQPLKPSLKTWFAVFQAICSRSSADSRASMAVLRLSSSEYPVETPLRSLPYMIRCAPSTLMASRSGPPKCQSCRSRHWRCAGRRPCRHRRKRGWIVPFSLGRSARREKSCIPDIPFFVIMISLLPYGLLLWFSFRRCSRRIRRTSSIVAGLPWQLCPPRTTSFDSTPARYALEYFTTPSSPPGGNACAAQP